MSASTRGRIAARAPGVEGRRRTREQALRNVAHVSNQAVLSDACLRQRARCPWAVNRKYTPRFACHQAQHGDAGTTTLSSGVRRSGRVHAVNVRRVLLAAVVAGALSVAGCGRGARSASGGGRTCLVLSVGGPKGVAHLGAIAAARDAGVRIDCVVGNSMGALVGSVYATNPTEDTTLRFKRLMSAYEEATRAEATSNGAGMGLLGAVLVLASGGAALPVMLGAGAGAAIGASGTNIVDHRRFVSVLNAFYGGAAIEQLPVPYATFYASKDGHHDAVGGNLADAVGGSIANPLIFSDIDVRSAGQIDPGLDRVSATPIDDACRLFPDARLLAVNVSGQAPFYSSRMNCPLLEVTVVVPPHDPASVLAGGPGFDDLVRAGYDATAEAIRRR